MRDNKDIISEMEDLLSQLKGFKKIYDSCEVKTEQFLSNYVSITDNIKIKLMSLSSEINSGIETKECNMVSDYSESKVTYIFHCGDYEVERSFKTEPTDIEFDEAFDDWINSFGLEKDDLFSMIETV